MKPSTFYGGLHLCMKIVCCPWYVVAGVMTFWSDRKSRKKNRRAKKIYLCELGAPGQVVVNPLPPRRKRKGSVLSLEEGCSDLAYPVPSSTSKLLKIGRGREAEGDQMTNDRGNRLSLTKLPYDIRVMIYREVLGGHMLHIFTRIRTEKMGWRVRESRFQAVSHIVCKACDCCFCFNDRSSADEWDGGGVALMDTCMCAREWDWLGRRCPKYDKPGRRVVVDETNRGRGLLSLLKTCRQVYSECIGILYSSNTFQFPNLGVLFAFKMTIPPQRQAAIRSIQLRQMYRSCVSFNASKMTHLRTPHGKNAWLSIIVGDSDTTQNNHAMTSLREIRIVISHYPVLVAYDGRTTIFDPIVDLVNAVAKVQGSYGSHGATTVVVDFPVFVDKDHPKMAEVLEKAPFLKFRTPRTAAQIPLDGTGRKRHMWYL